MLAKRRKIQLANGTQITTPLLLPSFSSKTLLDERVEKILEYHKSVITDELLVSAYDVYYKLIKEKQTRFCSTVFLDSGGYEASQDVDLSDQTGIAAIPQPWKNTFHQKVLDAWDFTHPTVVVSYDNPRAKITLEKQIKRATALFARYPNATAEFLIKAERSDQRFLCIADITRRAHDLSKFAIIGITEKEIGGSTMERMVNIAKLRNSLNLVGLETPIHVFGSLDTVSSVLYFLAGADIFDGLTWLRYAYENGNTLYKHNYGARTLGITFEDFRMNAKIWNDNYYYLLRLRDDMGRYLLNSDFKVFGANADFFLRAFDQFQAHMKGI